MLILSKEELDKIKKLDGDFHTNTAAKMFSVEVKDVTKGQRQFAKERNFAYCYGGYEAVTLKTL